MAKQTRPNYSVYAPRPFQLAEFDFLYNKLRVATKDVPLKTRTLVATVPGANALTAPVSKDDINSYLKISQASLVGKNDMTVLDNTVRKSSEILADQCNWILNSSPNSQPRSKIWHKPWDTQPK